MRHPGGRDTVPAARILRRGARSGRLMHVEEIAARPGEGVPWPEWVPEQITLAFSRAGVTRPWAHQAAMAEHAHQGSNVIVATPAASGKSLGYLLPALTAVLRGSTVLYLAPTRALAADQVRAIQALGIPGVCAAVVDGDTHAADRERARTHANYLLTTPDMLHHVLLPRHSRWGEFFGRLHYVIVDECHGYRGVFGSHVAHVLRRLRRVAAHHAHRHPARARPGAAAPDGLVFLLASATVSEPGNCARLLTGQAAQAITESTAPRGPLTFGLWEPPLTAARGEGGAPVRRPATAEAATLLADLVAHDVRGLAFTRSRRGAEAVAIAARRTLAGTTAAASQRAAARAAKRAAAQPAAANGQPAGGAQPAHRPHSPGGGPHSPPRRRRARGPNGTAQPGAASLAGRLANAETGRRVAAYRSGYLPEDRRELEEALRAGTLLGLAATTALELGVNICGLDAVLIAGWPGSRAALWQQAGRAGREGQHAVAVLIARDDPLDTYLVHHPEMLLHQPVEATVLDPENPYVLAPHLCAAAAELPLTEADLSLFGSSAAVPPRTWWRRGCCAAGGTGCTGPGAAVGTGPTCAATGNYPVKIVEKATGRLVGTVDQPSAHIFVHTGAVYLHQGELYLVTALNLAEGVALVEPGDPGYLTSAREVTGIDVVSELRQEAWGPATVSFGEVDVVRQVTSFTRRNPGERPAPGRGNARPAAARAAHPRRLVDDLRRPARCAAALRRRPRRSGTRCRAHRDRAAAAVRVLRPDGHRRRVRGPASRDRAVDCVRLRRERRRCRVRRARLRRGAGVAAGHGRGDRQLRVPGRVPVLRAVAEVRHRQRAAGQGRGRAAARNPPRRRAAAAALVPPAGPCPRPRGSPAALV